MNRRNFISAVLGLAAVPLAPKPILHPWAWLLDRAPMCRHGIIPVGLHGLPYHYYPGAKTEWLGISRKEFKFHG